MGSLVPYYVFLDNEYALVFVIWLFTFLKVPLKLIFVTNEMSS